MSKWEILSEELSAQIAKAKRNEEEEEGPQISQILYDKFAFLLTLVLVNGTMVRFSPSVVPELKHATHANLDKVHWNDDAIFWDTLNFSIHTKDLIKFVTNCKNT